MEGVLPLRVDREYFPDEPRLHHLRLPKHSATEPSRISGSQPRPSLHAGHQLRYQHKPSTLQRRRSLQQSAELLPAIIDAWTLLSQPDDRGPVPTVHQCSTGLCVAVAMVRGFVSRSQNLGNFYTDFVRSLTRLFLPLCFVAALIFVGLGVPQTIGGYQTVTTVEGATQTILVGPVASLVSIMQLG